MRDDPADLAEVRGFDIPASHRGTVGQAITLLKKSLGWGLLPVVRELLTPQVEFNTALASLLATPGPHLAERAPALLRPLANPTRWRGVPSPLQGQHRWNLEVLQWLSEAGAAWPPGERLGRERLDGLEARCDVLAGTAFGSTRGGAPLWRELLRRQIAFNHACVRTLRRLAGSARPALRMPSPEDYEAWCRAREPEEQARAAAAVARLTHRPLVSLLTPAYQTPPAVLRACIDSVQAQSYPHWELCLVDDGSPGPDVRRIVEDAARADSRIRFQRLEPNGGIARATNAALALATGEYVGFLDHDDELAPHALAEVVSHLSAHPDTEVLYTDEDKIDTGGRRFNPYFKPDWSPDLLRAVNYICHFVVVRASLARAVEGIRTGFEGAQDHDFLLRLMERTPRFAHLPRVLYHWRAMPGSTSLDSSAKPAASDAGRRAVVDHLRRMGEEGRVEVRAPGLYRVRHAVPGEALISLLLVPEGKTHWRAEDVRALREKTAWSRLEVVCGTGDLDPVPPDESGTHLERANRLAREAKGAVLVFLRPGFLPAEPGWLEELAAQALRPEVGVVGPGLVDARGLLLGGALWLGAKGQRIPAFAGLPEPSLTVMGGSHWTRNLSAVSGDCMALRRDLFEQLGGFDATRAPTEGDVEFCLRVGARGLRVLHVPHVRMVRAEPWRAGPESVTCRMPFSRDPFHHPHLSWDRSGLGWAGEARR